MSDYKENSFNEETLAFEGNSKDTDYDILDVVLEEKKPVIISVEQNKDEKENFEPLEGAENVTSVLPPYKRETVERTTEDITELSRKRNSVVYSYENPSSEEEKSEKYEAPELGMDLDELFKSFDLDNEKKAEVDLEKTAVIPPSFKISEEEYEEASDSSTKFFKLPKKEAKEKDISSTKYFNLKNYMKPDKDEAEKKLKESRKNLMQNFRVLSKNKGEDEAILEAIPTGEGKGSMMDNIKAENGEDLFEAVEKAEKKKRRPFKEEKKKAIISGKAASEELSEKLKKQRNLIIGLSVVFLFTVVLSFLKVSAEEEKGISMSLLGILNVLGVVATAFIAKKYFRSAAISLYYMNFDENTGLIISAVFTVLQSLLNIALAEKIQPESLKFYTSVAVFAVLWRAIGDYFKIGTARIGAETLIESDGITCIDTVTSKKDSSVLAHGLSEDGTPKILYCAEADMNVGVSTDSSTVKNEEKYYTYSIVAVLVVSIAVGALLAIKNKDFFSFFSAFLGTMSICIPAMCDTAASVLGFIENRRLSALGAAATSYEAVHEIGKSNAVVMDVSDVFKSTVSKFKRVPGSIISKSDSAVFAAATLKKAGSILAESFDELIEMMGITLPDAEDFAYEEGLGYSCWIADRRVLVGSRQMLIEHSIPAPTEFEEKQYGGKKSVMYVVVEGEITATFTINYKVLSKARKAARKFASTGLVLMLTSKEPALKEQTVSYALGLSVTNVKIISSKGIGIIERYRGDKSMRKSAGVFCSKKSGSIFSLVTYSYSLYSNNKFLFINHIITQIAAVCLMVLSVLLNMKVFFDPRMIIFYLLLCSAIALALTQREAIVELIKKFKKQ